MTTYYLFFMESIEVGLSTSGFIEEKNSSESCLTGNEHHESWFTWYRFSWKTRNSFELPKLVLEEVWINPGVQLFWKWCNMPQLPVYNFGLNRFMCVWTLWTKLLFWRNWSSISFVPSTKLHPNYALFNSQQCGNGSILHIF